ncbi:CGNR zinc finger domain-containing protein [Nocardiopsis tropica]
MGKATGKRDEDGESMQRHLALELASTIRHDGSGGVADDLDTVPDTARWLASVADLLPGAQVLGSGADEDLRDQVLALRGAVRALLARAVRPGPPSPADAHRLLPAEQALERLNSAASREPVVPRLRWDEGDVPVVELRSGGGACDTRVVAAMARSAIALLHGPDRERLRACTAPRCVRYFVQSHGRQQWCGTACGNRARAARHYERQVLARSAARPLRSVVES